MTTSMEEHEAPKQREIQQRISKVMTWERDAGEFLKTVHEELKRLMTVQRICVFVDGKFAHMFPSGPFYLNDKEGSLFGICEEGTFADRVVREGKIVQVRREELNEPLFKGPNSNSFHEASEKPEICIGIPLIDKGACVGGLVLMNFYDKTSFNGIGEDFWEELAAKIAIYLEKKRQEEETLVLRLSSEQSPVSIMVTDPDHYIEYVNPEFVRCTGYTFQEVIGQKPWIISSGRHSTFFYDELQHTIAQGKTWYGEFLNQRKDGELFWEKAIISPVLSKEGQVLHYVAVKEEITEQKEFRKQLHNAMLEGQENERRIIAETLHDDIQQDLVGLHMNLDSTRGTLEPEHPLHKRIKSAMDMVNGVTSKVRNMSHELGTRGLQMLGLGEAVENMIQEMGEKMPIEITANTTGEERFRKDLELVAYRMVQETLTNIAKHSGATKVHIDIRKYSFRSLIIRVQDNGKGFDEERTEGDGHGVTNLKSQAHYLEGRFKIYSKPGKGTVSLFVLPLERQMGQ